ncbi:type II toxin-antitoxin system ParD family antitoxin [Nostoc spongiaeforme FACHB-130]|uniref:Type II toxin-antitoxin system ParD family antitoxin n=1 Tax=Nostoc spongiaeforme FACHB-130 TaxID=1357510 RepID=A0ABR8FSV7_9NOSO|nr:type II toxin-antitoxin system ParD family antitoxin [Nostoc spongiaeforme]MBD2594219.1 type II toxin-antitoxin system ParD family antitoxin [Nostoc spongiaeforme FACHB-130]
MNISLTPELEAFVQKQVESGLYHSQSEVIREGLRLLKRFNDHSEEYKLWLNEQIAIGLTELDNAQSLPAEGVRERVRSKAQKLMKKRV